MRVAPALVVLTLSASLLAGCGGSDSAAYCKDLKADKAYFKSDSLNSGSAIEKAFEKFHELADEAPDEVKDDWKKVDDGISSVEKVMKDAGVKLSDLDKVSSGQLPDGVTQQDLEKVSAAFDKLDKGDFKKSTDAIEKHAKKECKVDISG